MTTNPFAQALSKEADEINRANAAAIKEAEKAAAEEERKRRHSVTIYARGCNTTRDCYCLNTNGFSHHEDDSPWVVNIKGDIDRGGGKEQPLEHPFLDEHEDLEDYRVRMAQVVAWDRAFEAAVEWVEACGRPADIGPPDPPRNPYLGK